MSREQALEAGIKELQKRPHHKGWFVGPDGESVCAVGSMIIGLGGSVIRQDSAINGWQIKWSDRSEVSAHYYLDTMAERKGFESIAQFNDAESTTKEDVILLMKEALHALENDA